MKNITEEKEKLEGGVRRSIRYHSRRRGFFESSHAVIMFIIVLFSSGSFLVLLNDIKKPQWCVIANLIITMIATLDLVIGFSRKAKDHEVLCKRFHDLQINMQKISAPTLQDISNWTEERLKIEADEPPKYEAVDISCHNEEARALGCDRAEFYHIAWWKRILMHLFRFPDTNWRKLD